MPDYVNPLPENCSEERWQQFVLHIAKMTGWRTAHFRPAQTKRGTWVTPVGGDGKGFPDLVLVKDHVAIFRELKTNKGVLSPEQKLWGAALGDSWGVWRPRDYEEVCKTLGFRPAVTKPYGTAKVAKGAFGATE